MNELPVPTPQRPLGGWAVLGLLRERDAHGWALVRALAPDGEIGTVWTIRRALVYRTIDQLVAATLVRSAGAQPGSRGSQRTLLRATSSAGEHHLEHWLDEPVPHVRDLRSSLLLKLLFARRAGHDTTALLQAQRRILIDTLTAFTDHTPDDTSPAAETIRAFRRETALAGLRFVEGELAGGAADGGAGDS